MPRALLLALAGLTAAHAHDTWVQPNTSTAPARQPVYVDLMLGNHGNNHRDFQLAGKIPLAGSTLTVRAPDGNSTDLKPLLIDVAAEEKEGYWSAGFLPSAEGIHVVGHTYDAIVTYAPKRSVKGAKAFFLSGTAPQPTSPPVWTIPLGHALELIPLADPTALRAGGRLRVRLLSKGRPLPDTVVSCIPRGKDLTGEFDPAHEVRTGPDGEAELPLTEPNIHLVVAHLKSPGETGEGYSAGTEYSATLILHVGF